MKSSRKSLGLKKGRPHTPVVKVTIYNFDWLPLPPGFVNKKNCCYANSIIQCFMNVLPLKQLCNCLVAMHPDRLDAKKVYNTYIILRYRNQQE